MDNHPMNHDISYDWSTFEAPDQSQFTEVYGFIGSGGVTTLDGIRIQPRNRPSKTLIVMMHPTTALQFLPLPPALARAGFHVLCANSRYSRNDTPLIMEKVLADLGSHIRRAREVWKYERIVLLGWSGGGALSFFYQSQASNPTIISTPAGDPYDLKAAGLTPGDAVIFQAAHLSRAEVLRNWIDPSVLDEDDPDRRTIELDIYDPSNPNQPPYSPDYIAHYRAAQLARIRKRTDWVKQMLEELRSKRGKEAERGFVTHRTMADLRFLDSAIDPNDRRPRWTHMGEPEQANTSPAGIARYSTLRAWLSQWSFDDSMIDAAKAGAQITEPVLVIENSADEACPASDPLTMYAALKSQDKTMKVIKGANHYYRGQPEQLREAIDIISTWLIQRHFWS
jgi:pimeloyl-ACP methyl ester carboxylesterase